MEDCGYGVRLLTSFDAVTDHPVEVDYFAMSLCTSGTASVTVNLDKYSIKSSDMLFFAPNDFVHIEAATVDFAMKQIYVTSVDLIREAATHILSFIKDVDSSRTFFIRERDSYSKGERIMADFCTIYDFLSLVKRYFDNVDISGVEIDQKITDLAVKYFELPENVDVTTYDGRAYLNAIHEKYDVIMVDAYQDITIPFQMSSVEFFELVKKHLTDDGVMVVNMNMRGTGEGNINQYLADTIAKVFSNVYTADVDGSTNRELFASNNDGMIDVFKTNLDAEKNEEIRTMMSRVSSELTEYVPGDLLMTDDKAPVELLGMKVIDELIRDEVAYYKQIYKDGGLKALLEKL